jgi:hypothetical protein
VTLRKETEKLFSTVAVSCTKRAAQKLHKFGE